MWQTLVDIKDRRKQAAKLLVSQATSQLADAQAKLSALELQKKQIQQSYQVLAIAPFNEQALMSQHALDNWRQQLAIEQQHINAVTQQISEQHQQISQLQTQLDQRRTDYQQAQFKLEKSKEIKQLYENADIAQQRQQEDNALDELPFRRRSAGFDL
ncbi:hypothetical protein [Photobacterium chitinilyticum]|uniref:Uncharacterized protein n=1 Tax=Photobacterium chitinilyticum TaxID=2485123 RepID=A0A3S3QZY2_9GAMM|nr:hypothetical protein [Photobacterium chitinilyticum]RWX54488.1 hypothetical protein EDI28_15385 [Photobacterium chitinilyticum]